AAAIAAMAGAEEARRHRPETEHKPLVGLSMFGLTTPAVDEARAELTALGYEALVFHATGAGGRAMEKLATDGRLAGVLDLTTTELADDLVGGVLSAGPHRLEAAGAAGIPQVVSLGALDMVNFGPREHVPDQFDDRTFVVHNPTVTLMRTTPEENTTLGERIGAKLAAATGPTAVVLPLGGLSGIDTDGQPFHDPQADAALFDALRGALAGSAVELVETEQNINDPGFGREAARRLHALITAQHRPRTCAGRNRHGPQHRTGQAPPERDRRAADHRRRRRHRHLREVRRGRWHRPDHHLQLRPLPDGRPRVSGRAARLRGRERHRDGDGRSEER